jgi:hypothetical protein
MRAARYLQVPKTYATWPDAPADRCLFGLVPGLPGHGMIFGLWG